RFSRDWSSDVCSSDLLLCTMRRTLRVQLRSPKPRRQLAALSHIGAENATRHASVARMNDAQLSPLRQARSACTMAPRVNLKRSWRERAQPDWVRFGGWRHARIGIPVRLVSDWWGVVDGSSLYHGNGAADRCLHI